MRPACASKLWKRSLKIYGYHLLMLALAFTVAAAFAVHTHKAAHQQSSQLLSCASDCGHHRLGAAALLPAAARHSADVCHVSVFHADAAVGSGAIWLAKNSRWPAAASGCWRNSDCATWCITGSCTSRICKIPLQETGAFNLFAWQAVWTVGLWLGARSATEARTFPQSPCLGWAALRLHCLFFIGIRYGWLGPHLTMQALGLQLDKWQIGPCECSIWSPSRSFFYWLRKYLITPGCD